MYKDEQSVLHVKNILTNEMKTEYMLFYMLQVRIHHIFVGCVILQKTEKDWSTTHLQRKTLQTLQR